MPEPPRFLVVENVRDESVTISWKAPVNDGGSPISSYIIEKMELSETIRVESTESAWSRCAITRMHHYTDETLLSEHKYQYRVIAQNLQGRSNPCEPTSVITTLGKSKFMWLETNKKKIFKLGNLKKRDRLL